MTGQTFRKYRNIYKKGLLEDILPFWENFAMDREDGGFTFCLDRDGSVLDTDKGVWQTARYTWMILTLYNEIERREDWLLTGRHGIEFLEKHCHDEHGKLYFMVDKKGQPLRMRRYVYSEAFAAIAYAAYYRATGKEQYRLKAAETFDRFREYNQTPGLIPPKYTEHRKKRSMGVPMIGIVTAQELRSNLQDDSYSAHITAWIREIEHFFLNHEYHAVMETVGPEGEFLDHFDGRTLNPGHAIEGAWFILREALHRGRNPELIHLGTTMLDWMWEIGWDKEYGGIFYFRDVKGLPVQEYWHDMKFWWPQNETVIATLLAYQLTGRQKYADWHRQIHEWAFKHFPDPDYGEWYGYLHRDCRISVHLKGNIWKGPFHVPRMYYMAWKICERLLNT
jgi:N-acylglucosamine 2-epimerase